MQKTPRLNKDTVYWLEDPSKVFLPEIAGDVEFRAAVGQLCYYDTQRPHVIEGVSYLGGEPPAEFRFESKSGRKVVMRVLDRQSFEKVFRPLIPGAPKFASDQAVQEYYRGLIRAF